MTERNVGDVELDEGVELGVVFRGGGGFQHGQGVEEAGWQCPGVVEESGESGEAVG